MKVNNLTHLVSRLNALKKRADGANAIVQVGFTQRYAVYVHENLDAYHPVGQAKFLEEPARTFQPEIARVVNEVYKKTGSMRQALLIGGLFLQRKAQERTPVDTSALRASAYTAAEEDAEGAAAEAFNASEQIRGGGA